MATVVIDNGTGYSKMGYAGNAEPSYLIPTVVADSYDKVTILLCLNFVYRNQALLLRLTNSQILS
jgi:actin-related protein